VALGAGELVRDGVRPAAHFGIAVRCARLCDQCGDHPPARPAIEVLDDREARGFGTDGVGEPGLAREALVARPPVDPA
jgi:hypothetical protein